MNLNRENSIGLIENFNCQVLEKNIPNDLLFSYFCVTHTQPHARNIPFLFYSEAYTTKIFTNFSCIAMEKMKIFAESRRQKALGRESVTQLFNHSVTQLFNFQINKSPNKQIF